MTGSLRVFSASKVLAAFGALLLWFAEPAAAQDARAVSLSWSLAPNAAGCITASELWTNLERHLSFGLQLRDDGLSVEGHMAKRADGRGFEATITLGGDTAHTRTLFARGDDCHALDQALLLVLAVAIEALAPPMAAAPSERSAAAGGGSASTAQRASESPRESARQPDEQPSQEEAARLRENVSRVNDVSSTPQPHPAHAMSQPAQQTRTRAARVDGEPVSEAPSVDAEQLWQLGAGLRFAFGLMPGPTTGALLALSRSSSHALMLELDVTLWPVGRQPTSAGDATFGAAGLDALACPQLLAAEHLQIFGCAGLGFGALRAHAALVDQRPVTRVRPLASASAQLQITVTLGMHGALSLRVVTGLSQELIRESFRVLDRSDQAVLLHRVSPWVWVTGLALGLAL